MPEMLVYYVNEAVLDLNIRLVDYICILLSLTYMILRGGIQNIEHFPNKQVVITLYTYIVGDVDI